MLIVDNRLCEDSFQYDSLTRDRALGQREDCLLYTSRAACRRRHKCRGGNRGRGKRRRRNRRRRGRCRYRRGFKPCAAHRRAERGSGGRTERPAGGADGGAHAGCGRMTYKILYNDSKDTGESRKMCIRDRFLAVSFSQLSISTLSELWYNMST